MSALPGVAVCSTQNGPETLLEQRPALTTTMLEHRMAKTDYHSEQWKQIAEFPQYEVSNLGRVRNRDYKGTGPRLLRPGNVRGYHAVVLSHEGETFNRKVHRLVCEAFHGPAPTEDHQCAHNDGNSFNNHAENLRWATILENVGDRYKHGTMCRGETSGKSKLTEELVQEIRTSAESGAAIARRLGLQKTTISAVRRRLTWAHVP